MGGEDRGLIADAGACRCEDAADLADELAACPEGSCLVEEIPHLAGHVAKARRHAKDHGVVIGEFMRSGDGGGLIGNYALDIPYMIPMFRA